MAVTPIDNRIINPWGERTPYAAGEAWPTRVDMKLSVPEDQVDRWVRSASVLDSNGDALDIAVSRNRIVGVRGRSDDRVNRGRLGPKNLYGWQANHDSGRLTSPLVRKNGQLTPASWNEAMDLIAERCRSVLHTQGPSGVGFYTSGQLFLEEYWTLATIARAGIGTNHLDGNTRLCTATAGEALKESFGSDGQPASYDDVDHADVIALFGHNVAETQPVLWMRMLDRLSGPNPPRLIVVDPRVTPVAARAHVHVTPRPGTNLALMNALVHGVISRGAVAEDFVAANTVGFDELREQTAGCTAAWAADICHVPESDITRAIDLLCSAQRLLCTVLQGFYQSHQATAASVQVNNLVLLRGMLARPGCGVLQMNGQPTAQNTRECGANGDLPGFRNWQNHQHIEQLAEVWNVDKLQIPHYGPPTNAMQMFRYAEQGSIRFLWISGTNPAVSLPELSRIRKTLSQHDLFVIAQDIFRTETTLLADVVLPAAMWGEKTGTFTNVDRTVHLSEKAVDPPGQARSDLDIFIDFARRMELRDRDGAPLVSWRDAESAFNAWRRCSAGRPCDYSGMSYDLLRQRSIQWPCNEQAPNGTARLYMGGGFWASADDAETYGRDLITGASIEETEYRALNPAGKAVLKAAEYVPPHQDRSASFPFQLTTGRTIYHFHTRTKTARAPELQAAAPSVWAEIAEDDASRLGVANGDLIDLRSARGVVRARVRIAAIRPGSIFLPFHYGYWQDGAAGPASNTPGTAANEVTVTDWDPVSKQPLFKNSAVAVEPVQ